MHKLDEFIRTTLSSIIAEKSAAENKLPIDTLDILKSIEKHSERPAKLYLNNNCFYKENPIRLHSDSEDYLSSESSYDSDWIDEPIKDLESTLSLESEDIDVCNDDILGSVVQQSLEKCVKHAQFDLKDDPDSSGDDDDNSVEFHLLD